MEPSQAGAECPKWVIIDVRMHRQTIRSTTPASGLQRARALNRFAILVVVGLNNILLRGFWCVLLVEVILPRLTEDIPMNIQHSTSITPLRARMIADMSARNLGSASQSNHLRACKRFAAFLRRSPETATPDDVKNFQQYLIESGMSICTRNQTMTGVKFLFRVTLRRHDLVAEIFHLRGTGPCSAGAEPEGDQTHPRNGTQLESARYAVTGLRVRAALRARSFG